MAVSGWRSSLIFKIILGVLLLLTFGDVKITDAAKKCQFNGEKFTAGELVVRVEESCTSFYCQPKKNKKGKPTKKVEIVAEMDSLDGCQCNIVPRHTVDARKMRDDEVARRHNFRKREAREQTAFSKVTRTRRGDPLARNKRKTILKARKNKRKCKFNKKKYKANLTIMELPERCMDLVCVKESKKVSVIRAMLKPDCTCSEAGGSSDGSSGNTDGGGSGSGGGSGGGTTRKCSDYSEKYSNSHSMCQPKSSTCSINSEGISEQEKTKILKIHNDYRVKVANGDEERGSPGPQPSASNMRQIVWRQELADVAQAWANTCPTYHDCNDCRRILGEDYFVGQNLYWSWSFSEDEEWEKAMSSFYDEVQYVPNTLVDNYQSIITVSQIGHYTQLVWAETYEVGCAAMIHGPCTQGFISYQVCKIYVCNYGPAGNFIGQPMYKRGQPASDCPNGKSNKYEGLCK